MYLACRVRLAAVVGVHLQVQCVYIGDVGTYMTIFQKGGGRLKIVVLHMPL